MNSKRKGSQGERELLEVLQGQGDAIRNDQRYIGGVGNPDILFVRHGRRYHVECKRCEKLNIHAAMSQAIADCRNALPMVMHRKNREKWLVTMPLEVFLEVTNDTGNV